jgi:hypothetical protein
MFVMLGDVPEENIFHDQEGNQNQHADDDEGETKVSPYLRYLGMCHAV